MIEFLKNLFMLGFYFVAWTIFMAAVLAVLPRGDKNNDFTIK